MIPKRKGYNIGANLVESLHFSSIGGGVIHCPVVMLVLPSPGLPSKFDVVLDIIVLWIEVVRVLDLVDL